jgi:hypothetical protein
MDSQENENRLTCSHCGDDNVIYQNVWLMRMDGGDTVRCSSCNQPLVDRQFTDSQGTAGQRAQTFNIAFFIIVFLLSGLLIYLNRVFDVLTLKDKSGHP